MLERVVREVGGLEAGVGVSLAEMEVKKAAKSRMDQALAPFRVLAAAWAGGVMLERLDCDDTGYLAAYRRDPEIWGRALAELRRAVADNPENVLAWMGLAQEYGYAGPSAREQRLEALTHAATVLAGNPATGQIHAERAEVLLRLGRADEATGAAHEALRLDGNLLLPRYVLAAVAERRGAWVEARDQLRTILARLRPDDGEAQDIGRRLEAAERNVHGDASR
jgi:tetratricopeptide (TPR) repeat protein